MAERNWNIDGPDVLVPNNEELYEALAEAAGIIDRIGGAFIVAAQRREIAKHHYVTDAFTFRWSSFMPATRLEDAAEPEPEHEPVAAAA